MKTTKPYFWWTVAREVKQVNFTFLSGDSLWFVGAVDNYAYKSDHIYMAPDCSKYVVLCHKTESREAAQKIWNVLKATPSLSDVKFTAL